MSATIPENPALITVRDLDADSLRMKTILSIAAVKEERILAAVDDLRETHYLLATEMCPFQLGQSVQYSTDTDQGPVRNTLMIVGIMFIPRPPYYQLYMRKKREKRVGHRRIPDPLHRDGYGWVYLFYDVASLVGIHNSHGTTPEFKAMVEKNYLSGLIITRPPWMGKEHPLMLETPVRNSDNLRKRVVKKDTYRETFHIPQGLVTRKRTMDTICTKQLGKVQRKAELSRNASRKELKKIQAKYEPIKAVWVKEPHELIKPKRVKKWRWRKRPKVKRKVPWWCIRRYRKGYSATGEYGIISKMLKKEAKERPKNTLSVLGFAGGQVPKEVND